MSLGKLLQSILQLFPFWQQIVEIFHYCHSPTQLWQVSSLVSYFQATEVFGPSEVGALPVRRCRRAAWQMLVATKIIVLFSFFLSSSFFLYLITFLPEGIVLEIFR